MARDSRIKEFAVSVARTIGRDPVTGVALFYGTANASTAVTLNATATDIRGGIANPIIYRWIHDRGLTVTINKPTFEKDFLALNVGGEILNDEVLVVQTDCIDLDAEGKGELKYVPDGVVSIMLPNGTVATTTVTGDKTFTMPSVKGQRITAIYNTLKRVDILSIGATEPPKVIDLTLIIDKRDQNNSLRELLHVHLPKFQIDGNYELSLASDGVSQETLTGTALTIEGDRCNLGDTFGEFIWESVEGNVLASVADIVAIPNPIEVTADASADQTQQLTVMGLRGHNLGNVDITDDCTYAIAETPTPDEDITVDETGLVKVAQTATAGDSATINVTYTADGNEYVTSVPVTVS